MTITAGPIGASTLCYPDFVEGQVLSHNDLNLLRDFLNSRFAFENEAMLGFGVACGLDGTKDVTNLTISAGFALAQGGRLLRRDQPFTLAWSNVVTTAAAAAAEPLTFNFVDAMGPGYTAVLVPDDTHTSAGGTCDANTCTTHTDTWCEASRIVIVKGRLTAPPASANPAAALTPLTVSMTAMPTAAQFVALRDGLATLLTPLLPADAITLLKNLTLIGPAGVDVMKIGLVNEALYALWEYYRCRSYDTASCYGPAGSPAVALGWLDPAAKTWDCSFRHHFMLAKALDRAMRGYRCVDLCRQYLDHILQILRDFTPPVVPPAGQPGTKDPDPVRKCKTLADCLRVYGPIKDLPYIVVIGDPARYRPPKWGPNPGGPVERYEQYTAKELTQLVIDVDPTGGGLISLQEYIGFDAVAVKNVVDAAIPGTVQILPVAGLNNVAGIEPVLITATSDQVYFGTNAQGVILSIGAVPTGHELRQVPAIAVTARGAAGDAHLALDTAKGFDVKYGQEFTTFGQKLDGFGQQLAKFPDATKVGQLERKSNTLELGVNKNAKDVAVMQQELLTHTEQIKVHETKVGEILGTQAQHQAELAVHGAIVTRIDEATTKLDAELTNLGDHLAGRIDQVSGRFDAQAGKLIVGGGREMVVSANASIVGALDAMRIAVEAAAAKTKGVQVRKALAAADPHLSVLRGLVASDTPLTASNADAIAGTVHALFDAVRAAGLSPDSSEYKALDQEVAQLNDALGLPGAPG